MLIYGINEIQNVIKTVLLTLSQFGRVQHPSTMPFMWKIYPFHSVSLWWPFCSTVLQSTLNSSVKIKLVLCRKKFPQHSSHMNEILILFPDFCHFHEISQFVFQALLNYGAKLTVATPYRATTWKKVETIILTVNRHFPIPP